MARWVCRHARPISAPHCGYALARLPLAADVRTARSRFHKQPRTNANGSENNDTDMGLELEVSMINTAVFKKNLQR